MGRVCKQSQLYFSQSLVNNVTDRLAVSLRRKCQIHKVLIICMVLITAVSASLAKGSDNKKQKSDSSSASQRYIKEPYDSKDYMMLLGEQLGAEKRSVLLFGIDQS